MAEQQTERRAGAWQAHRWLARAVRVLAVVVPVGAGVGTSYVLATIMPTPPSSTVRILEIVGLAVAGVMVTVATTELAQKLLPLSTLLGLTLVFEDATPSRMRIALRVSSDARLRAIIDDTRANGLPTEPGLAAERVLELVAALSYHDRLTRGHAERVRGYSALITSEMGLAPRTVEKLQWAGLLHDIGKINIPSEILNKPGRLTDDEFEVIKRHPAYGERMLEPLRPWLGDIVDAAGQHHERWDGRGYPRGLDGEDIALAARIVAVADVFDVITSSRSYKDPSSAADARVEIARCAGTQFDAHVVRAFLAIPLSRLRRIMGPLTLLGEIPILGTIPGAATAAVNAAAAVGTIGAMTVASVSALAPAAPDGPPPASAQVLGENLGTPAATSTTTAATVGTTTTTTGADTSVPSTTEDTVTSVASTLPTVRTTLPGVGTTLPISTTLPPVETTLPVQTTLPVETTLPDVTTTTLPIKTVPTFPGF